MKVRGAYTYHAKFILNICSLQIIPSTTSSLVQRFEVDIPGLILSRLCVSLGAKRMPLEDKVLASRAAQASEARLLILNALRIIYYWKKVKREEKSEEMRIIYGDDCP